MGAYERPEKYISNKNKMKNQEELFVNSHIKMDVLNKKRCKTIYFE